MHAPQPCKESAKRWLRVESVPPSQTVGVADMGRLVVLEGAEYWACVRVETGGLEWVVVTACQLWRQQFRGPACYRAFQECLRELGPVRRAHKCTAEDIPPAPAVFVEVTRPPAIQGQDIWPIAPSNMWQAEHAAVMCRALQGHAAALPRAPAAQSSSNRPAASLALLHSVSPAWCWVVAALEPHSSALRLYDRGRGKVLTVRPADLEALHLSALSGDGGDALYLQGTVTGAAATRFRWQSGGDALRLVMAENMGPWLRAFSTSRWKVGNDREKFADAWRRWVEEQFPVGGMLHLPQPPSVPPVRPAAFPAAAARPAPKAAPKPPPKRSPPPQYGAYANIRYVLQHFGGDLATEQHGSKTINVCPWSRLDGAGHCTWRAGKHCRPTHLRPQDLLDHIRRDHAADPVQRDQALAMLAGVMPGGQAGPFASAQARSRALMLPTGAPPATERGASPSAARSGAIGSAARRGAVTSTGGTAASTYGGQEEGETAASAGFQQTTAASGGGPQGKGPPRQPPAPGAGGALGPAGGPPPSSDPDPVHGGPRSKRASMKGPRLRHPSGGVLERPGLDAGGRRMTPGMLDGEAVAAGVMKAEGAILSLFRETGLQDPQGVVNSENQWRHHRYHAYPGVDAQAASAAAVRGGLLIALRADVFAAEEVRDVVDIVPGMAMSLNVVTAGGTLTVINVHGQGSGGDSWASKASFWADVAMYVAAKSAGGTRAVVLGGDFNV